MLSQLWHSGEAADGFTKLADNAVVFMGSVQRSIDLQSADLEAFLA